MKIEFRTKQQSKHAVERAKSQNYEKAMDVCHSRLSFTIVCIGLAFLILVMRLYHLALFSSVEDIKIASNTGVREDFTLKRASITDRSGELLAVNISTASLYAVPRDLSDPESTARKIASVLPGLDYPSVLSKLKSGKSFVWLKRHLTPKEQQEVHDLGIPGVYFTRDEKRVYPQANLFAHTVGFADVDGKGLAGLEKYFDKDMTESTDHPLVLSMDLGVQSIVRDELITAIEQNDAIGGSALVMDVNNGEILSMVSFPDFNPNKIETSTEREMFNQITLGLYELGSVFKVFTTAAAFDLNVLRVNDTFDVSAPYKIANFKIKDYMGKGGTLSVPEIFMYSSNIGTAQIATNVGVKNQREYLRRFGLLDKLNIELKEVSAPRYPSERKWNEVSLITISYGHGIADTPLHLARAIAASINGGILVEPTLLKRSGAAFISSERVINEETSLLMRKMMRLVMKNGFASRNDIPGYFIGGKSGTAEKICGTGYCKHSNLSLFAGVYPIYDPRYMVLVIVDEAKPTKFNSGVLSGSAVSSAAVAKIIKRMSPVIGVYPVLERLDEIDQSLTLDFQPRYKKLRR